MPKTLEEKMSEQYKKNVVGCFVVILGLMLMLIGASLVFDTNIRNLQIQGLVIVLVGGGLTAVPLLWAKNIAYDKDGNEIYWRNEKELEEKLGKRH
jgi:hypothetical protein